MTKWLQWHLNSPGFSSWVMGHGSWYMVGWSASYVSMELGWIRGDTDTPGWWLEKSRWMDPLCQQCPWFFIIVIIVSNTSNSSSGSHSNNSSSNSSSCSMTNRSSLAVCSLFVISSTTGSSINSSQTELSPSDSSSFSLEGFRRVCSHRQSHSLTWTKVLHKPCTVFSLAYVTVCAAKNGKDRCYIEQCSLGYYERIFKFYNHEFSFDSP